MASSRMVDVWLTEEEDRRKEAGRGIPDVVADPMLGGMPVTPEYLRMSSLVSYEVDLVKEYPPVVRSPSPLALLDDTRLTATGGTW